MDIDIKSYIISDIGRRVNIINEIKNKMSDLCSQKEEYGILISNGKYNGYYNFSIKLDGYELNSYVTIQDIYNYIIESDKNVDYAIYEVITNKAYKLLENELRESIK